MRAPPSLATTRRVWAAVSRDPQATCRGLATMVGCSNGTVAAALRELRQAGYIRYRTYHTGRTIIVPFIVREKQ